MSKDITKAEYEIIDVFYTSSTATRSNSNAQDKLQRVRCLRGRLCVLMCKVMCGLHINMHAQRERGRDTPTAKMSTTTTTASCTCYSRVVKFVVLNSCSFIFQQTPSQTLSSL